jgi:MFS family permease
MKNKKNDKAGLKGFVYVAVGVAAIGGLLFGYDTGVISGAILFIQKQYALSSIMEEVVVSSVLVGAIIGAAIGGVLTNRYGRRKMIILAGIIFTISALGTAFAPSVTWLIAGRLISGIAIGIASFISPMYIGELVPAKVRGSLVAINMLAITTGIVVAYLVDYAYSGSEGWRYMFGLAAIPSIGLVIGMWVLPDSPRWLVSKSKVQQAKQVLQRVRTVHDVTPEITEICFAFGLGPIFWLLISEIYPLKVRGAAMSAVTVTNWAMNLIVAVTFLSLVSFLGHALTFWLYGVIAIGAWIFFYKLVPETKGKSLEQIEEHWRSGKTSRSL